MIFQMIRVNLIIVEKRVSNGMNTLVLYSTKLKGTFVIVVRLCKLCDQIYL